MNNKKLYLSNTSIKTFLKCKRKFKYKYLDKITTETNKSNKYLSFGNSIHKTLADFNSIKDSKYRNLDILQNLLRKNWIREGYESISEEKEFGIRGLDMLASYYSNPLDDGKQNLLIEEMIYKNTGDYVLCGKLDKVFVNKDDYVEIIDYKTGNSIVPIDTLQLPIYLILAKEKLGYYPRAVSLYYLSKNKKIFEKIDENFIKFYTKDTFDICNKIINENDFSCNPNPHCKDNCEYFNICDASKCESISESILLKNTSKEHFKDCIF